jgi:hypothetical protein
MLEQTQTPEIDRSASNEEHLSIHAIGANKATQTKA